MNYSTDLSQDEIQFFNDNGYLIIRNLLTPSETKNLQQWAQEVHDLPRTPEVPWMPYEVSHLHFGLSSLTIVFQFPLFPLSRAPSLTT